MMNRKRSKVSRACDQCRRKKVRCNATFNSVTNLLERPCTHCQKAGEICAFERTPLKRGPSKGYQRLEHENFSIPTSPVSNSSASPVSPTSPGLQRSDSGSINSILNPVESDTDEYKHAVSNYYMGASSPANSSSSLSSITNGVSRTMWVTPPSPSSFSPQQMMSPTSVSVSVLPPQLDANLGFYYKLIHKDFMLIPLERSEFDSTINGMAPTTENRAVVDIFGRVLQILVRIVSKEDINILNPAFDNLPLTSRVVLVKDMFHPLMAQLFQLYPSVASDSSNFANVLLIISLNLAGFAASCCGESTRVPSLMAFSILTNANIHKDLTLINSNIKLWQVKNLITASILDAIHCLSFGAPPCFANINLCPDIIDKLCCDRPEAAISALNHFKGGLMFTQIVSLLSTYSTELLNVDFSYSEKLESLGLKKYELFKSNKISSYLDMGKNKDLTTSFLSMIELRFQFIDILRKARSIELNISNEFVVQELHRQLGHSCSQLLFKIIDVLAIVTDNSQLSSLPGSASQSLPQTLRIQSPFICLLYKQSIILTNVIKMVVMSMGFRSEFSLDTEEGFKTINVFEQDIKLVYNTYLPLLKPFNDSNNYGITNSEVVNNNYCMDITEIVFEGCINVFDNFLEKLTVPGGQVKYRYIEKGFAIPEEKFRLWKKFIGQIESFLKNEDLRGWLIDGIASPKKNRSKDGIFV